MFNFDNIRFLTIFHKSVIVTTVFALEHPLKFKKLLFHVLYAKPNLAVKYEI